MTAKRPSDKQIERVFNWLTEKVGLSVYGPVINERGELWDESGYQDYSVKQILLRWKAIKREEKESGHS
jgi:hypothetical protein